MQPLKVVFVPTSEKLLHIFDDHVLRHPGLSIHGSALNELVSSIVMHMISRLFLAKARAGGTGYEHIDVCGAEAEVRRYLLWRRGG